MSFDLDRPVGRVRQSPAEIRGERPRIDQGSGQASPPVAGLVVPVAAIALTRLRAISMRWTSDGPS
jgi:hypothetical protein